MILQAHNGKELTEQLNPKNLPDLVITDLRMPFMSGYETVPILKQKYPEIKIMVLSMYEDKETMLLLIKAGAQGFINKNAAVADIRKAIHDIMNKGYYFANQSIARIFKQLLETGKPSDLRTLNEPELHYLKFLCQGKTDKEIAGIMGLTNRRTEQIRYSLFDRFEVQSRTALAVLSFEKGIVIPD